MAEDLEILKMGDLTTEEKQAMYEVMQVAS